MCLSFVEALLGGVAVANGIGIAAGTWTANGITPKASADLSSVSGSSLGAIAGDDDGGDMGATLL